MTVVTETPLASGDGDPYIEWGVDDLERLANQRAKQDGGLALHSVNRGMYTGLGSVGIGRQPIDTGHFTLRNGGMPPVMP